MIKQVAGIVDCDCKSGSNVFNQYHSQISGELNDRKDSITIGI